MSKGVHVTQGYSEVPEEGQLSNLDSFSEGEINCGDSGDNMMLQHSLVATVEFVSDNVHSMETIDEQLGQNFESREEKREEEDVLDILATIGKEWSIRIHTLGVANNMHLVDMDSIIQPYVDTIWESFVPKLIWVIYIG